MEAVGQLTGGVAHDFNNLLTIILGNLEMAKRQLAARTDGDYAKLSRRIDNAMQGATRAAKLTKRLLAFSRQQPLNPAVIDVNRLLNGLADFLQRAIGEHIVARDRRRRRRCGRSKPTRPSSSPPILNLAVNARDAMRDGGKLTIEAEQRLSRRGLLPPQPRGPAGPVRADHHDRHRRGHDEETMARAFEPFFTTKQAGQGTGLGLSQVYGFVKQSGGHVKIYSEPGDGTSIKIYLRRHRRRLVARNEATAAARAEAGAARPSWWRRTTTTCAPTSSRRSTSLGYKVIGASGAEPALAALARDARDQPPPHRRRHAGKERAEARRGGAEAPPRSQGAVHDRLFAQRDRPSGTARSRVALIQKPLTSDELAAAVRRVLDA